jgi:hypothetical protein
MAAPLAVIALSGTLMAHPWANALSIESPEITFLRRGQKQN